MINLTVSAVVKTEVLDSWIQGLRPNVDKALQETAAKVETDVKINIQQKHIIDTGNLLNSIGFTKIDEGMYEVTDGTEYGVFQELGTRRGVIARPFFIPAVEKNTQVLYEKLAQAVNR